jgi:hypothetical protein
MMTTFAHLSAARVPSTDVSRTPAPWEVPEGRGGCRSMWGGLELQTGGGRGAPA